MFENEFKFYCYYKYVGWDSKEKYLQIEPQGPQRLSKMLFNKTFNNLIWYNKQN